LSEEGRQASSAPGIKRQAKVIAAASEKYRRLNPCVSGEKFAVSSGEVNQMIAAAINANPRWFWHGPDASTSGF
jgi:hypothetical protein